MLVGTWSVGQMARDNSRGVEMGGFYEFNCNLKISPVHLPRGWGMGGGVEKQLLMKFELQGSFTDSTFPYNTMQINSFPCI